MSQSSTRRLGFLLVFAVLVAVGLAYFHAAQSAPVKAKEPTKSPVPRHGPSWAADVACKDGNHSFSHPIICVVGDKLMAKPNPAYIYDVEQSKDHKRTSRRVIVH